MARKRVASLAAEKKPTEKPVEKPSKKTEENTLRALIEFRDKEGKIIRKGEEYSHADAEYIEYLQGNKNKTGAPVIGK